VPSLLEFVWGEVVEVVEGAEDVDVSLPFEELESVPGYRELEGLLE